LTELDTSAEGAGQVAHEPAKVYAPLSRKIDDQLVLVELPFGLGGFHLEAVLGDQLSCFGADPLFVGAE
jgi:hypothetical protein